MPLEKLSLLAGFAKTPFAEDYPAHSTMTFFAKDMTTQVVTNLLHSVESSLVLATYGFDTEEIRQLVIAKLNKPDIYVQLSIFGPDPGDLTDGALVNFDLMPSNSVRWKNDLGRTTIGIIDGTDTFVHYRGMYLTVTRHAQIAAQWRAELDLVHGKMK